MDPCLENFISRNRGRNMTRINLFSTLSIVTVLVMVPAVIAGEPKVPIPADGTPYDWQCVYAYTETTCEDVIEQWAEAQFGDSSEWSDELVLCGNCTEILGTDSQGSKWIVGYRCNDQHGYQILADDLQVAIPLYREATSKDGWEVNDWALFRCLRTWNCYDYCTWERGEPACFIVTVIGIGRFQPVLGAPCDQQTTGESEPDVEPDPSDAESPSDDESPSDVWVPNPGIPEGSDPGGMWY